MPYTHNTPEPHMLWRIQYDHDEPHGPEVFIIRWNNIIAIKRHRTNGCHWMIRIYFSDTWIQFEEKETPDAAALLELWNNQCILQEY